MNTTSNTVRRGLRFFVASLATTSTSRLRAMLDGYRLTRKLDRELHALVSAELSYRVRVGA